MSDIEKMTLKSQEAMKSAADMAERENHSAVELEHLALQLLKQDDGIVCQVIAEMGAT